MMSVIGKKINELDTPAFCVDKEQFERNCQKIRSYADTLNVKIRGQTKTHKTVEGGVIQTGNTKRCIVVSTLVEAEMYAEHGFDDILYGYPLSPNKIPRCQKLLEQLEDFHVLIDNPTIFKELQETEFHKKWSVFLKVDCGTKRAGVWWEDQGGIDLAKEINQSHHCSFAGIYIHCGNSYTSKSIGSSVSEIAQESTSRALQFVRRLEAEGVTCPTFGIGSTPTCSNPVEEMKHLTEIHPGNYTFYDSMQYSLGSCQLWEVACFVGTRIIGHYPRRNQVLIDCGFAGLTKQGLHQLPSGCVIFKDREDLKSLSHLAYFPLVCNGGGEWLLSLRFFPHPGLKLVDMTQEIGKVETVDGSPLDFEKLPIGSMLFMYPWHVSQKMAHELADKALDKKICVLSPSAWAFGWMRSRCRTELHVN